MATSGARAILAALAAVLAASPALAQPHLQLHGELGVAELYDDNLFGASHGMEPDFITRLSPRLGAAFHTRAFSLSANYMVDAEAFRNHPALDTWRAREEAGVEARWSPTHSVTAAASASYADTQSARELNLLTRIDVGRVPAHRFSVRDSISVRLGALTRLVVGTTFSSERSAVSPGMDERVATLGLERRMGPADRLALDYDLRQFVGAGVATTSQVLTLGWKRQVTPLAELDLSVGPRLSEFGGPALELSAGLRHRLPGGEVILAYVQTQTTVVGEAGLVGVQGVTATLNRRLFRRLSLRGGPAIFSTRRNMLEATVFEVDAALEFRIARRLALVASQQWSLQQGSIVRSGVDDVAHKSFMLSLAAVPASR